MPPLFTGDEIISDIIDLLPEAIEILSSHGLGCATCHINVAETLRQGAQLHGFTDVDLAEILTDLNQAATEFGLDPARAQRPDPVLTPRAAERIRHFQAEDNLQGHGFKIEVEALTDGEVTYFLDFLPAPEPDDRTIPSQGIDLYLSPYSHTQLRGYQIDFSDEPTTYGFTITPVSASSPTP